MHKVWIVGKMSQIGTGAAARLQKLGHRAVGYGIGGKVVTTVEREARQQLAVKSWDAVMLGARVPRISVAMRVVVAALAG